MKWRNLYDFNIHFPHAVMRPLSNVLHIHFRNWEDAMVFLGRLGLLDFKKPEDSLWWVGSGGPFKDSWFGKCWSGGEWSCQIAEFPAFGKTLLRREIEQIFQFNGNLIATYGGNWAQYYKVRHELAHAVWHLKPAYRERALAVVAKMSPPLRRDILNNLANRGYTDSDEPLEEQNELLANETQAFLFAGTGFALNENGAPVAKKRRELAFHRAKLFEAMECHYPMVNHTTGLQVWRWRTLHDARQGAAYAVSCGEDSVRCQTLDAPSVVLPDRPSPFENWGEGRIDLPWKEVQPIAIAG